MTQRKKANRKIVVEGVNYLWRATGDSGHVTVTIWPADKTGPAIVSQVSHGRVVASGIIRQIIEHAVQVRGYNPRTKGVLLSLYGVDGVLDWERVRQGSQRV